ncbi:MAG: metal-dependent hydrolase [Candidatus Pacearchaeota archaeon]
MLVRTHFSISIFAMILFLPLVNSPVIFIIMVLLGTFLPDIAAILVQVEKRQNKLIHFISIHHNFLHSLTICLLVSIIFSIFIPILAFGFFLGYSLHLLADSFTKTGITPFWPYPRKIEGPLNYGSVVEKSLFFTFVILDVLLLFFTLTK